jgi:hypothetical protein
MMNSTRIVPGLPHFAYLLAPNRHRYQALRFLVADWHLRSPQAQFGPQVADLTDGVSDNNTRLRSSFTRLVRSSDRRRMDVRYGQQVLPSIPLRRYRSHPEGLEGCGVDSR